LFLITLYSLEKSHEIYKLTSLCYIAIKVEPYMSQIALTQCHNCQQQTAGNLPAASGVEAAISTGNAWKRARNIQRRLAATVTLAEGEQPHASNYRGCSHAKEEMRKRKIPRTPKPSTGRAFSSRHITSGVSFAEALQSKADQTQQSHPRQAAAAATVAVDQPRVQTSSQ
jgi:hypothetical protein